MKSLVIPISVSVIVLVAMVPAIVVVVRGLAQMVRLLA